MKTRGKAAKIVRNMARRRSAIDGEGPRGLLLLAGEGPRRSVLEAVLERAEVVVAADAGFDLGLRLGVEPDFLVGDLDSVKATEALARFPEQRIRRFPAAKDETDAEIGLGLLRELGCGPVTIAGGGGGRLDHLLGIVGLFERERPPQAWYTAVEHVQLVEGELAVEGCRGQTVSFFPLGEGASGLSSRGLRWPLDGLAWRRGQAGISNVVEAEGFRVSVRRGRLLMVRLLGVGEDAGED